MTFYNGVPLTMAKHIDIINKMDRAMYDVQLYLTDDTSGELTGRLEALADMLEFLVLRLEIEYELNESYRKFGKKNGKEKSEWQVNHEHRVHL